MTTKLMGWTCPGCGKGYGPYTYSCWYCGIKTASSSSTNTMPVSWSEIVHVDPRLAFVAGAQWWEWHSRGATMWPSDRALAEAEAERRYPGGQPAPAGQTSERRSRERER